VILVTKSLIYLILDLTAGIRLACVCEPRQLYYGIFLR
jgi:hypothetical protein